MAGIGRKIASYVGIVDDRRYDEEDLPDEELTTEVYSDDGYEPPAVEAAWFSPQFHFNCIDIIWIRSLFCSATSATRAASILRKIS